MFARFTDRCLKIMAFANQEAQRLGHEGIDPEHVVLGLAKEGGGVGARALTNLNVDLDELRCDIEKLLESGKSSIEAGKLPLTPRTRQVIVSAIEQCRTLGHNYVATEHLLLGVLHEENGVAAKLLTGLGVSLEAARREIVEIICRHNKNNDQCQGPATTDQ